jgi:hypothetical protein
MIAAAMLIGAVGLVCEQRLGPTPGYSLSHDAGGLQLSP